MEVGQQLPVQMFRVTRADLVRYAGASGDFNPIHWNERTAQAVGLPGVIAHGMLTMALAGQAVTGWVGAPDAVLDFGVRFTRPVPVPDDDTGTEVEVSAVVKSVTDSPVPEGRVPQSGAGEPPADGAGGEGRIAELELTATCGGQRVLSQARARVRLGGAPAYPYTGSA